MCSSPTWLTIALTTLSTEDTNPAQILQSGMRSLSSRHILYHLNRWARHVWRPAVNPSALSALVESPDRESLSALGVGALSLLAALIETVRRCEAEQWAEVLGVMFLAEDPWAVEVGREGNEKAVDEAVRVANWLFEREEEVKEVMSKVIATVREVDVGGVEGDSIAELRCRVAALQLQLDDVTTVVRRNEKNTKDLLSSFHFWSMLLLDELRSYKAMVGKSVSGDSTDGKALEKFAKSVGDTVKYGINEDSLSNGRDENLRKEQSQGAVERGVGVKPKRVFRDGKWITL